MSSVSIVASSGWDWGPETFVAVGTIGLAAVTACLAWTTRALARSTRDDVSSQARPIIIPTSLPNVVASGVQQTIHIDITNVGRGPALRIVVEVAPHGGSAVNPDLAVLAPGARIRLETSSFTSSPVGLSQVLLDYYDAAGRTYATAILLAQDTGQPMRIYDVVPYADTKLTRRGHRPQHPGLPIVAGQERDPRAPAWWRRVWRAGRGGDA